VYNNKISFLISGGYVDRRGSFSIETILPVRDDINSGNVEYVTTENKLSADLGYIEIQPDIRYLLSDRFINGPLRFVFAPRITFPVNSSFLQTEKIISPDNATFKFNGRKEREIALGKIETITPFNYGISLGFENMLDIGRGNFITQQILFDYNFPNVTEDVNWKTFGFRFIAGLRYSIQKTEKEPITPPILPLPLPDTTSIITKKQDTVVPFIDIEITGIDAYIYKGSYLMATLPLVNAIFFPINLADLPPKYILSSFKLPSFIEGDAINLHRYVIPRIVKIMEKNPDSKLLIAGATSGKENEQDGLKLAKERADTVLSAFLKSGLSEKRMRTTASIYPRFPSNQDYEKGAVENQRVDLFVEKAPLQEYVSLLKFVEIRGNVKINLVSKELKENQKIIINTSFYDTTIVATKNDSFNIPIRIPYFDITGKTSLDVKATAGLIEDNDNLEIKPSMLPVKEVEIDLSKFEAILRFDYNSSNLSEDNKGLLKQMTEILPKGTTVIIFGSADALGTEERNKQLEFERAKVTKDFIQSISKDKFIFITDVNKSKFPENTEEGRLLNRSMKIILK
jgi:outer membrane protein OmpA-like peptidoglycan-associated protein